MSPWLRAALVEYRASLRRRHQGCALDASSSSLYSTRPLGCTLGQAAHHIAGSTFAVPARRRAWQHDFLDLCLLAQALVALPLGQSQLVLVAVSGAQCLRLTHPLADTHRHFALLLFAGPSSHLQYAAIARRHPQQLAPHSPLAGPVCGDRLCGPGGAV